VSAVVLLVVLPLLLLQNCPTQQQSQHWMAGLGLAAAQAAHQQQLLLPILLVSLVPLLGSGHTHDAPAQAA
jgi:hypothetical protein